MFWTQFKLMFRNLWNNKLQSLINIFGLAIAVTVVLILSSYVSNETSVDSFHRNKDRIYRVHGDNIETFGPPFGQYILNNVPEAEAYTRVYSVNGIINYDGRKLESGNCLLVDSAFFTMFSFPVLAGEPDRLLAANENVVLSKSFAKKVFGDKNPIGENLEFSGNSFIVSGIFEDFKDNTHFVKPNMLMNFSMLPRIWGRRDEKGIQQFLQSYGNSSFGLYVMAHKNSDIKAREAELLSKIQKFYWVYQNNRNNEISFMPLEDVYFERSALSYIGTRQGNKKFLSVLSIIALAIVFIAAVNYINLSITQSVKRAREVGIKKIIGSFRWSIINQFLMESTIISFISTLIAVVLTAIILPVFNQLVNTDFRFSDVFNQGFLLRSIIVVFAIGFIAGLIPSLILSGYKSVEIVKGVPSRLKSNFSQKAMVVFQYAISIVLIIVVILIIKQNNFMKNYNLGFDKDHTFYVKMNTEINKQIATFRNELMKIPGVEAVSFCSDFPGGPINNYSFVYNDKPFSFDQFRVDTAFFSALGIPLEKRISLTNNTGNQNYAVLLNRTAVSELELEPPYNEFEFQNNKITINQIVNDMNFRSLYQEPRPTVFMVSDINWASYALIRGNGNNLGSIVNQTKKIFKDIAPTEPLILNFINDALNTAYQKEERTAKIVGYFAIFAILISSLGIFALASYTTQYRKKEVGLRKVNGANITEILKLLNKDFIKWVVFAFIIAIPIAWYSSQKWLENFAYKTALSWWIFALAGILAFGIALITVSWQSWKAATRNPVEALRYE
ncbi:ABC transporter permease [Saccharicrinis sp. FJH2]|uniref:ABC transporter permease n=1 Tax=Saccharicrinis sp. FJH65 TaxID=3344659 RepID=UPI0035F3F01A